MKTFFLFFLLTGLTTSLHAGIIASIGALPTGGTESAEKATNDKAFLNLNQSTGFIGELELPLGWLSLAASASYLQQKGTSQFVRSSGAIIPDLETKADSILGSASLRLKFINFKRFKMFVGGGPTFGAVNLSFDKNDFTAKGGPLSEYKDQERVSNYGTHFELGAQFVLDNKQAVRGFLKLVDTKTAKVSAFNDKAIGIDYGSIVFQYMYFFDWKFNRSSKE